MEEKYNKIVIHSSDILSDSDVLFILFLVPNFYPWAYITFII